MFAGSTLLDCLKPRYLKIIVRDCLQRYCICYEMIKLYDMCVVYIGIVAVSCADYFYFARNWVWCVSNGVAAC